jgi:peptidoglycan-associated lipoprotein
MSYFKLAALGLLFILLAGCSKNTIPDPEPAESTVGSDSGSDAGTDGYGDGSGFDDGTEIPYDPYADELALTIYFDFDSSEVRAEDADVVARHAVQLSNNAGMTVRLEGHADERGSREYNIGLGERRSQAVRRMLLIQGASASQISTVSFGEERPAEFGSDESAYAKNRRVVIQYTD